MLFAQIKSLDEIKLIANEDDDGDWFGEKSGELCIFSEDVGKIVDIDREDYCDNYRYSREYIMWAVDKLLTEEKYPEYYL